MSQDPVAADRSRSEENRFLSLPVPLATGLQEVVHRRKDWLAGLPMDADLLLQLPGIQRLHQNRDRELLWIPPSPSRPTLLLKLHRESDRFARIRRALGWGRARLEWFFLRHAEKLEVPVPRPVGWFSSPSGDGLFTEFLLDTEPFPQYLEQFSGDDRALILYRLGELVAKLIKAGIEARDLHTGNILARGSDAVSTQLWVVDLHDARHRPVILEAARERMLEQVAQALGGSRAGTDVERMLEGWAAAARQMGIDNSWGRGPVQSSMGVQFQSVCPKRRQRLEDRVESRERKRRRKRIRRGLSQRHAHKNGDGWTWSRQQSLNSMRFPERIRWRSLRQQKVRSAGLKRAWQGNLIEQVLLHHQAPVLLFRESATKGRVRQQLIEVAPEGPTLRHWLLEETGANSHHGVMEAVIKEVSLRHRQGIRIQGATPDHWFAVQRNGQWAVRVDPWCLNYQGILSPKDRLEDILAVTAHFSDSVSRTDRLRWILRCFPKEEERLALKKKWRRELEGLARALQSPSSQPWHEQIISSVIDGDRRQADSIPQHRLESLHALNEANAPEVGSLQFGEFSKLIDRSHRVWTVDDLQTCGTDPAGILVVMNRGSKYDSPNFQWFRRGFERFGYIDRIAVDDRARRKGIGEALYLTMEAWARSRGLQRLVCEVNLNPRNEDSIAFHHSLGFREVGQFIGRGKGVLMLEKLLSER